MVQSTRLQGYLRGAPWLRQSALGLRDAALRLSGSVNAGGMLTPYAANHNSGARPRTDSSTDGLNLSTVARETTQYCSYSYSR